MFSTRNINKKITQNLIKRAETQKVIQKFVTSKNSKLLLLLKIYTLRHSHNTFQNLKFQKFSFSKHANPRPK